MNFFSDANMSYLWKATPLINRGVVFGNDFAFDLVNKNYDWANFMKSKKLEVSTNYCYLNESLPEFFRIGMLKSCFFQRLSSLLYCKGRIPRGKEEIYHFIKDKFNDKKMKKILDKLYGNKYSKIDEIVKDVIFFNKKINLWKGVSI